MREEREIRGGAVKREEREERMIIYWAVG